MRILHFLRVLFLALSLAACAAHADDVQEANRLFKQGQYTHALVKLNAHLSKNPQDPQGRFLKGLILTEMNRLSEATKVFTELTEDFPELPEPYNNLAVLYAAQGQYEKAKNSLEMAIRTHPSYATAHENLGDIYAKMASLAYDKALQLDKSNTTAQTKLALIKELFVASKETPVAETKPAPAAKPPGTVIAKAEPDPTLQQQNAQPAKPQAAPSTGAKKEEPAEQRPTPGKPAAGKAEQPAANPKLEVEKTVREWAQAWSKQDVTQYLDFYAPDFKVPGKATREDWEAERRQRLTAPARIEVSLSNLQIKLNKSGEAEARFRQTYRSDRLTSRTSKSLILAKSGDRWLIREERTR
jgi:tetratricopeptide (TPR) repeat protein